MGTIRMPISGMCADTVAVPVTAFRDRQSNTGVVIETGSDNIMAQVALILNPPSPNSFVS